MINIPSNASLKVLTALVQKQNKQKNNKMTTTTTKNHELYFKEARSI